MKTTIYRVKADHYYGDDKEEKRANQLKLLYELGLIETDREVYCNTDQALSLILGGYNSRYSLESAVTEIKTVEQGCDVDTVKELMKSAIDSVAQAAQTSFNERCSQQQPGNALFDVESLTLMQDACTDELQYKLNEGWRIIAVQPQPDQRRPDYILGKKA